MKNAINLWNVFNTIQENRIKGGQFVGYSDKDRMQRTRSIKLIDKDVKLNRAYGHLQKKCVN